ncbi:cell division cycle protein 16 homolog isoform X1 [Euwallacea similis]|uniref:cell division cycle protein 16 homolog isoform X1 n=1 Tax=Euwallacea similis TaxID=1736056 RepID=UPI00344FC085
MKTLDKISVLAEKYRKLVQQYINLHVYSAALFWADKAVVLTNNPKDVFWLAQCMFLQKQYQRAAFQLQSKGLDKSYLLCTYLTAKCYYEANDLNEALKVINNSELNTLLCNGTFDPSMSEVELTLFDDTPKSQAISSFLLLKGKILEAMDNRGLASDCYKQALRYDIYCFEAFDRLVKYQMLDAKEERELLQSIPIQDQCPPEEAAVMKSLYELRLKKYHTPTPHLPPPVTVMNQPVENTPGSVNSLPASPYIQLPTSISTPMIPSNVGKNDQNKMQVDTVIDAQIVAKLQCSLELLVSQAEVLYYNCDYQNCLKLTEQVLKKDPYHEGCLPIYISCMVELKQSTKLFSMAHALVDLYPNLAISWFAVGCYYYVTGKSDSARGYLAKATCIDKLFGPAWLAYGHSFASENEHDQAMAAYFKASQLMRGCHLPHLYIGLECGLTHNIWLAEKFFLQAQCIAPEDPFILHERGVISFQSQDYEKAEDYFREALVKIKRIQLGSIPTIWAPLLNNLGHVSRKLKKYKESLQFHNEALVLMSQHVPTISAIAYVHSLMENYDDAVEWFHKALSLKRDDTFSTTMLSYVLEQWAEEKVPFSDCPEGLPKFEPISRNVSMEQSGPSLESGQDMPPVGNETQNESVEMSIDM